MTIRKESTQTSSNQLLIVSKIIHTYTANQVATMTSQLCGYEDSPVSDRAKAVEENPQSVVMSHTTRRPNRCEYRRKVTARSDNYTPKFYN